MPCQSTLRENIAALYAAQMASYVAPLLTLPWLTRVLGPAEFGRLSLCVAVTSYFVLFADYGFNLSATRQIALHADSRTARSRVFWNTLAVKSLLACAGFPCLLLLTWVFHPFAAQRPLLIINYLTVVGSVLTPVWYFQGTERQTTLSAIGIAVRLASVPAVYLFVRSSVDVNIAAFIPAGMTVLGGILCCTVIARSREIDRVGLQLNELGGVMRDGWHLFLSTASISLYQATNTVVLGLVAGNVAVGHYSAAEKIIQAAQGLLGPINQSVFPRVSRMMADSADAAFALIRRLLRIQGSIALGISVAVFLAAPLLITTLYGPAYAETVDVLRWLAALPFLIGLSNVLGVHTMIAMGMNRAVSRVLVTAGALNVVLLYILARWLDAVGAAMAVVITEFFVAATMAMILHRRNVPVFALSSIG